MSGRSGWSGPFGRWSAWALVLLVPVGLGAAPREVPLIRAVQDGDVGAVRRLLEGRADVNEAAVDGTTALHWAVQGEHAEVVDLLLAAGARASAANRYGVTPLTIACTTGHAAIVGRLLRAGAHPRTRLPGGETALMTASRTGRSDVVRALLAAGADVNAREETRGQTALMWAAAEGHADVIRLLVEAGADLRARSHGPQPPAGASRAHESRPGVNSAVSRDYRRFGRVDEYSPLLFAVRAGHLDAVRALLDLGAGVNEPAADGTSAVVVAALNAHWELGALLLERGADPDASAQGWTALHQVARTRTLNIGQYPHPVATGRLSGLDLARRLLDHGADVNARQQKDFADGYRNRMNRIGATPLLLAAKGADAAMMRLLASRGADPQLTNADGVTILMAAAGVDMVYVNEDSGTNDDALEAVTVALELGVEVNAASRKGDTALHGAAGRGANPIVRLLVERGARLDAANAQGWTPLNVANGEADLITFQRRPETVELFRELMTARGLPVDDAWFVSPTSRADPLPGSGARPAAR
jgi:ankyrin repeat protein